MVLDMILVIFLALAAGLGFEVAITMLEADTAAALALLSMKVLIPRSIFSVLLNIMVFTGNYEAASVLLGKVPQWEIFMTTFIGAVSIELLVGALFRALRRPRQ